ncbi:hypothetical protein NG798_08405 [Ancylothrix sp. C2]|uniref:KGK domain-containing protein n=1 Tax=Ancylothrix sp. D3o TaxID=2953691 RepID=UPI0021BB809D|nr:KGK domain-containing protein [Ancylothrix sp. D3o]MCT7949806.1 hypothetical protein [Ancylothrix sp. D3o]
MGEEFRPVELDDGDVICFVGGWGITSEQLVTSFQEVIKHNEKSNLQALVDEGLMIDDDNESYLLFTKGVNAEVLRIGSQAWQEGTIRIKYSIEFSPNEPENPEIEGTPAPPENESPLDDIRRLMKDEN